MDVRLLILFLLHPIICFPLDYDAEAEKFFAVEGIKNPTSREKGLARKIIYERQQANDLIAELGRLKYEKDRAVQLTEAMGVFAYLRLLLVQYEWLLDYDKSTSPEVTDVELEQLGLPVNLTDQTVKNNLRTRYSKWLKILRNTADERIAQFKSQVMPKLGFKDDTHFAKYVAFSFCELSDLGTNFPKSMITFSNEEKVITALKYWRIENEMILNTVRALYRLDSLPVQSSSSKND